MNIMIKSWVIAKRELKERITNRSFLILSIVGPLMVLGLIYILFSLGGKEQKHWNVLISDPAGIYESRMLTQKDPSVTYSFADGYIETNDFSNNERYQKFDALLEINEKILTNKLAFVFYREKPSLKMQSRIHYQTERRLEEVLVNQFTRFTMAEFKKIKQPLNIPFKNVYNPYNQSTTINGWVGLFYGAIIILFIFLFGMTILRSIGQEKSNRVVEVLLGSISPKQLMLGKIIGIGIAALIQFFIWASIILIGLYIIKDNFYIDLFDFKNTAISSDSTNLNLNKDYNQFVELIYDRINFKFMTLFFIIILTFGYLFYGSFFASIGAASGSESDGQQFVLPLLFILGLAIYSGYYYLKNPSSSIANFLHFNPFTSPIIIMVQLAQGYDAGNQYQLILSILILILSSYIVLSFAGRVYSNGILQFGHRVKLKLLLQWLRKKRL